MPQNLGDQTISFAYGQSATSMVFNRLNHRLHSSGIYWGGNVVINSNTEVSIDRFVAYLNDNPNRLGVRVETNEIATIDISESTPYIRVRMYWENRRGNTAYIESVGQDDVDYDRATAYIAKAIYESGDLIDIDYTFQDRISLSNIADKRKLPFYVAAEDPYSSNVTMNGGKIKLYDTTVTLTDASIHIPNTTDGRIDVIALSPEGNIILMQGVDSATPVKPDLDGNIEIAEIERGAGRTTVYGTEIKQTLADVIIPKLKGMDTDDNGDLILTYLTPERLIATDIDKKMVSIDLIDWIQGATNETVVEDAGGGEVIVRLATNPTIQGDLTVNESFTANDPTNKGSGVGGDFSIGGSNTVSGSQTVGGNQSVSGGATVSKALNVNDEDEAGNSIGGTLDVGGDTTITGAVSATGDGSIGGNNTVVGNNSIGGNNTVTGDNTVNGNSNVKKALDVTDQDQTGSNIGGALNIGGDTTVNGGIVAKQNSTMEKNLTVQGNLTVMGSETVVNTVEMTVEDNMLVLNTGEQGSGVSAGTSGIEIYRNTLDNTTFIWDENTETFRVGTVNKEEGKIQAVDNLTITLEDTIATTDAEYFNGKRVNVRKTDSSFVYGTVAETGNNYDPATFEVTVQSWVDGTPVAGDFYSITMESNTKQLARIEDVVNPDELPILNADGILEPSTYGVSDLEFFDKSGFTGIYEDLDFITPTDTSSTDEIEDLTETTGDFILRVNRNYDTLLEGRPSGVSAGSTAEAPLAQDGSNKYFLLTGLTNTEIENFVDGDTFLRFRSSYEDYISSATPLAHIFLTDETLTTATVKKKIIVTADYPAFLPPYTKEYILKNVGATFSGGVDFGNTGLELNLSGTPTLNYLGKETVLPDTSAMPLRYLYKDDTDTWQFSDYETFHTNLMDSKVVNGVESALDDDDYVMKAIYVAPPIDSQSTEPQYFEVSIDGVFNSEYLFDDYVYSEDRYLLDKQFRDMGFTELGLVVVKKESGTLSVDKTYTVPARIQNRTGIGAGAGAGAVQMDDLLDVTVDTPLEGELLVYNAVTEEWENKPAEATTVSEYEAQEEITFSSL